MTELGTSARAGFIHIAQQQASFSLFYMCVYIIITHTTHTHTYPHICIVLNTRVTPALPVKCLLGVCALRVDHLVLDN